MDAAGTSVARWTPRGFMCGKVHISSISLALLVLLECPRMRTRPSSQAVVGLQCASLIDAVLYCFRLLENTFDNARLSGNTLDNFEFACGNNAS
jgi:hypothetical protein